MRLRFINKSTGVSTRRIILQDEYGFRYLIQDSYQVIRLGINGDDLDDYDQDELDGIVGDTEKVHLKSKYEDMMANQ